MQPAAHDCIGRHAPTCMRGVNAADCCEAVCCARMHVCPATHNGCVVRRRCCAVGAGGQWQRQQQPQAQLPAAGRQGRAGRLQQQQLPGEVRVRRGGSGDVAISGTGARQRGLCAPRRRRRSCGVLRRGAQRAEQRCRDTHAAAPQLTSLCWRRRHAPPPRQCCWRRGAAGRRAERRQGWRAAQQQQGRRQRRPAGAPAAGRPAAAAWAGAR